MFYPYRVPLDQKVTSFELLMHYTHHTLAIVTFQSSNFVVALFF